MGIGVGNRMFAFDAIRKDRWLTSEIFVEWLEKHDIFGVIFGESLHVEVLKKSYFLLDFL